MRLSLAALRTWGALVLVAGWSLGGCGRDANAPQRPLPAYEGRALELFDDGVDPKAVGLDPDTSPPRADPKLRERTQVGDATLRCRVSTVTSRREEADATYAIGFRSLEHYAGSYPPPPTFAARVDRRSPSIGILRALEGRLVGMTFTCFVRMFVRPDGDQELHFHLGPDTPDVVAAVRDAAALADMR